LLAIKITRSSSRPPVRPHLQLHRHILEISEKYQSSDHFFHFFIAKCASNHRSIERR